MTLETMREVVAELKRRAVPCNLEYPGFISVRIPPTGARHNYGDANDTIQGDVYDVPIDNEPDEHLESDIPADSTDFKRIADWIACNYTEACGKVPECRSPEV